MNSNLKIFCTLCLVSLLFSFTNAAESEIPIREIVAKSVGWALPSILLPAFVWRVFFAFQSGEKKLLDRALLQSFAGQSPAYSFCALCAVSLLSNSIFAAEPEPTTSEIPSREVVAKSRVFNLRYGSTLKKLQQFEQVRVWLPMPTSDAYQNVTLVENSLPAGSYQITHDRKFGNS